MRFFSRRYRAIAYNARGYPPSDVPKDVAAYSQEQAADDILGVLDALGIARAHVCGLSMGGYATLTSASATRGARCRWSWRARLRQRGRGARPVQAGLGATVKRFEAEGMAKVAGMYARGPTRVQFIDKDPRGWQEFHDQLAAGSAEGHALTMRGVQMKRPSIYELEAGSSGSTCPR